MNTNMDGKRINVFDVHPCWTPHGNPERVASGRGRVLTLSATHHGDHDQFWIVESIGDDTIGYREVRRWHVNAVAHIEWCADTEAKPNAG
jgi:hypothetical protein